MIIIRYLLWRFCLYWSAVSGILATLFVMIDFFSKLQGHSGDGFARLAAYFFWSALPTVFEVLPVSIWLASLLLLRELSRRNEFEAMVLSGMGSFFLIQIGVLAGLFCALLTCCAQDYLMVDLLNTAQRERCELIKGQTAWVVENRWVVLEPGLFASVSRLDCGSGIGNGLALFKIKDGLIQSVTTADHFCMQNKIESTHVMLCLHGVSVLTADKDIVANNKAERQPVPNFLYAMQSDQRGYSLVQSLTLLLGRARLDDVCCGANMIRSAVDRVVCFLSLLFYPVVTIALFVATPHTPLMGWLGAFSVYLFFNGCKLILGVWIAAGASSLILFVPYLFILLVGLFLVGFALVKKRFRS